MNTTYMQIPTYDPKNKNGYDYTRLHTVAIQEVDGLRVVLGNPNDDSAPDVLIERDVGLWRLFVHPDRGDPMCVIEIGRYKATIEDARGASLLEKALP